MHPALPSYVILAVTKYSESPVGPFNLAVLRLGSRAGAHPRGFLLGAVASTEAAAKELRGRDVTVNAVAPGPTATPLFLEGKPQETIDNLRNMSPLQRLGEPDDIAEAVAHLAGPGRYRLTSAL